MLPDSAREKPMSGSVVSVGPGKRDKDGSRKTPKVSMTGLLPGFLFTASNKALLTGWQCLVCCR